MSLVSLLRVAVVRIVCLVVVVGCLWHLTVMRLWVVTLVVGSVVGLGRIMIVLLDLLGVG